MMTSMYMSQILNNMWHKPVMKMKIFWSKYTGQNFENDRFLKEETFKEV